MTEDFIRDNVHQNRMRQTLDSVKKNKEIIIIISKQKKIANPEFYF